MICNFFEIDVIQHYVLMIYKAYALILIRLYDIIHLKR